MGHCSKKHAGEELDNDKAVYFSSLGRATCVDCSFIRLRRGTCARCRSSTLPRRVAAGDSILPLALGPVVESGDAAMGSVVGASVAVSDAADPAAAARDGASAVAPATGSALPETRSADAPAAPLAGTPGASAGGAAAAAQPPRPRRAAPMAPGFTHRRVDRDPVTRQRRGATPQISDDFIAQVQQISGQSHIHLPKGVRERACAHFSDALEGMLDGDETWAVLLYAFTRLVFYSMPYGMSPVPELEQRLAHWEAAEFSELLARIQAQAAGKQREIFRSAQTLRSSQLAGKRARRLAKENAKAKAVAGLQGGVKQLTPDEQRAWGTKLLPRSERPGARPAAAPPQAAEAARAGPARGGATQVSVEAENPLQGVRFAPLTAPGPSGCRPEHLKEMLGVRKRSVANRLLRLLARFAEQALAGSLPPVARWILGSNVTFLEKPETDTPRPIRSGEWLRKLAGKKGLQRHRKRIINLMVSLAQYGVAIPGGAEALFHASDAIETLAASGAMGPIAVVDVDLVNCFGSLEWDAIVEAYDKLLPEMSSWERWVTAESGEARLQCGDTVEVDRGAGQGEPDGPLKTAVTLGSATKKAKAMPNSALASENVDFWFLDDGRFVTRPQRVDAALRCLDACLNEVGATRGSRSTHAKIKSVVRVFCPPERLHEIEGWDTAYVRETCRIAQLDEPLRYLGGILGSNEQVAAAFGATCSKVDALHSSIEQVEDAATELALKSACADVSKVMYTLRLNGDRLPEDVLTSYSAVLRASATRTLAGAVGDDQWSQATCATKAGGLGLRPAEEVALPAFVASRIGAWPAVRELFQRVEAEGLAPAGALEAVYSQRTEDAVRRFLASFAEADVRSSVETAVQEAAAAAEEWWTSLTSGQDAAAADRSAGRPVGAELVDDDAGIDESDLRPGALALQKILCAFVDKQRLDALSDHFREQGHEEDALRLDDLRDPHQDHSWISSLNPEVDVVLPESDWLVAMRIRLGCPLLSGEHVCRSCGESILDSQCFHALCCSMAESTRGHNNVRNMMHAGFSVSDPGAALEVAGLVPSAPDLRPADILTVAAHETACVAVDVGIKAPHSLDAGLDCTETMKQDKIRKYEVHLPELERQGIYYKPATFSSFGRRHPDTTNMMTLAARRAARYRGLSDHRNMLNRWFRSVSAEVWRRAASMARACLPGDSNDAEFCLTGERLAEDDASAADAAAAMVFQ